MAHGERLIIHMTMTAQGSFAIFKCQVESRDSAGPVHRRLEPEESLAAARSLLRLAQTLLE